MKKLLFLTTVCLFVSMAKATVIPPADARGSSLLNPAFVGCQTASIDNSTGTSLVMINSTGTGGLAIPGGAIVYGVITSSIAQGDYLVLKDTSGAGSTGQIAAQTGAGSLQGVGSTVAVIGNWYQGIQSTFTAQIPFPNLNIITFPVPLQFPNGILANASAAPLSNNGSSRWTILWRPMLSTNLKSGQ